MGELNFKIQQGRPLEGTSVGSLELSGSLDLEFKQNQKLACDEITLITCNNEKMKITLSDGGFTIVYLDYFGRPIAVVKFENGDIHRIMEI